MKVYRIRDVTINMYIFILSRPKNYDDKHHYNCYCNDVSLNATTLFLSETKHIQIITTTVNKRDISKNTRAKIDFTDVPDEHFPESQVLMRIFNLCWKSFQCIKLIFASRLHVTHPTLTFFIFAF